MERIAEEGVDATEITPLKLGMPILKELGAKWILEMGEYISDHPSIIVTKGLSNLAFRKHWMETVMKRMTKKITVKARKT